MHENEEIKEAINTLFKNQNLQNEIIENQKNILIIIQHVI